MTPSCRTLVTGPDGAGGGGADTDPPPPPHAASSTASRTAPANSSTNTITRYEAMFGAISRRMMFSVPTPLSRARSTKSRFRKENVWARTALATHGQEKTPITSAWIHRLRCPR